MPCFEDIVDAPDGSATGDDPSPPTSQLFISDEEVTDKVSGGQSIVFSVGVNPINFLSVISVDWGTSPGTAVAGTHYAGASGTLNIPIGDSEGTISIDVIGNFSNTNPKYFYVNLSNPVNATIDDAQGKGTIRYQAVSVDPLARRKFQSISRANRKILDQYSVCSHRNQCTAYAMGSWMSVNEVIEAGLKRAFEVNELFTGSGGTPCTSAQCASSSCASWYDTRVHSYTRTTGIRRLTEAGGNTSEFRKVANIKEITSFSSLRAGSASANKLAYIQAIKKTIFYRRAAYISSLWYTSWNSSTVTSNNPYMRGQSGWGATTLGHSYCLVGWDDDYTHGGSFIVQNSLGTRWGSGGWGYLPYAHLKDSWNGTKFRRTSSDGRPWFRVFSMEYRP